MVSETPRPLKPEFGDFLHSGIMLGCASMALMAGVFAASAMTFVVGSLLHFPYAMAVAGLVFFVGTAFAVFIANDVNTRVRLMRSLAKERAHEEETR